MHDLVPRAVSGEPAAVAALLERYGALVWGLCVASADDPDDCYQEIWEKALRALPRFDPSGPARLSTWLHRVAHHHLIDRHRRRTTRSVVEPLDAEPPIAPVVEEHLSRHQRARRLRTALARLPDAQRRAVVAHYLDELPLAEVAALEGVPVGTIKSRLHAGRGKLLELLGGLP